MAKLLKSNLLRLLRSLSFWICMIIQLAYIVINILLRITFHEFGGLDAMYMSIVTIENAFFPSAGFAVLIMGILFIGEEYSSKTIDHKIILGFSKTEIYMSYFLTIFIGSMIILVAKLITLSHVILPLLVDGYKFDYRSQYLLAILFLTVFLMAFYSAFSVLIITLSKNSTTALWTTIIFYIGFLLLIIANIIELDYIPEEYLEHSVQSIIQDNNLIYENMPSKFKRDCNKFFADYIPFLQCMQISEGQPLCVWQMTLYSCINTAITLFGGVHFFKKQQLK